MMGSTVLDGKVRGFIFGLKDWTPKQKSQLALVAWNAYGKSLSLSTDPLHSGTAKCNASALIVEKMFAGLISLVDGLEPVDELAFQIELCGLLIANEQRVLTSGCVRGLVERCVQKQIPGQFKVWRDLLHLLCRMNHCGIKALRPQDDPKSLIKLIVRYAEQVGDSSDWSAVAVTLECMKQLSETRNPGIDLLRKLDVGISAQNFQHILQLACELPAGSVRRTALLALMESPAAQEKSALVQDGMAMQILEFRAETSKSRDYTFSEDIYSVSDILFKSATNDRSNSSRASADYEESGLSRARMLLDAVSKAGFPTPQHAELEQAVLKLREQIYWRSGLSDDEE